MVNGWIGSLELICASALKGPIAVGVYTNGNVVCVAGDASNIGTGFGVLSAEGLVLLRIQLRDSSGETLSLWREVHVDNTP